MILIRTSYDLARKTRWQKRSPWNHHLLKGSWESNGREGIHLFFTLQVAWGSVLYILRIPKKENKMQPCAETLPFCTDYQKIFCAGVQKVFSNRYPFFYSFFLPIIADLSISWIFEIAEQFSFQSTIASDLQGSKGDFQQKKVQIRTSTSNKKVQDSSAVILNCSIQVWSIFHQLESVSSECESFIKFFIWASASLVV